MLWPPSWTPSQMMSLKSTQAKAKKLSSAKEAKSSHHGRRHQIRNDTLASMVIEGLTSMGIPNACSFVIHWLNKCFHAIANFVEGCEYVKLECKWDSEQIKAFMEYLYNKHYAVSTLDTQWSTLCLVGKTLGEWIPLELEVSFQFVKDEGKETKDDKFLISRRLLFELCEASDVVLTGHNVLLAKTMFLCVWTFSM